MRKEQELQEKFKKDTAFEEILSLMNNTLYKAEDKLIKHLPERYPTVQVIGAPRSGTTLAVQILAERLGVGYINNLIAAFWKAPLFGIALSKQLLDDEFQSSFSSKFGRTGRIQEPHEFGYFWNYHLKYDDFLQKNTSHEEEIDWNKLATLLKNMCHAFEKPIVFKSFLLGFHASKMARELTKSCFVYIRRDIIDNAMSILKLRKEYLGDINKWASIKPNQYSYLKEQDRYVQVIGQVLFLEYEYLKQLNKLSDKNKLIVDYHDICQKTEEVLKDVNSLIGNHCQEYTELEPKEKCAKLTINKYNRDNLEVNKLMNALRFLISEFPELSDLIENRNINYID